MEVKAEFINPFLQAAAEVLEKEAHTRVHRGRISVQDSAYTTQEVTTILGVTGSVRGVVIYGMSQQTALEIISEMLGERPTEFDQLAQSGIAEMGNVITGRAAMLLEEAGYPSKISPPILITGKGARISTLQIRRIIIPLHTARGQLEIAVALHANS